MEHLLRDESQDQVLFLASAGPAAGVLPHYVGQSVKLVRSDVAAIRFHMHREIALLFLGLNVGVAPHGEVAATVGPVGVVGDQLWRSLPHHLFYVHKRLGVDETDLL